MQSLVRTRRGFPVDVYLKSAEHVLYVCSIFVVKSKIGEFCAWGIGFSKELILFVGSEEARLILEVGAVVESNAELGVAKLLLILF